MCKFFSVVSDGTGNVMYFNARQRKQIIAGNMFDKNGNKIMSTDSHSSILSYNDIFAVEEDLYNKYEYNPLTKEFIVDQLNNKDDSSIVKSFCINFDYSTIVPELIVKEIINPKDIQHEDKITDFEINLLHEWISVWTSVRDSVWDSVRDSVGASVRDSVWASVWYSVGDSVGDSVWTSVRDSVRYSVWDSVRYSVRAYISSLFPGIKKWKHINHEEGVNPFQPAIDLWHMGLVPSFDGKTWQLHQMCNNAKIIYQWKK